MPLHTPNGSRCSCGRADCKSFGKHPRTHHGVKEACKDPLTIRKWWKRWPDANVGIATGSVSGFDILDVDARNRGLDSLRWLQEQYGALPPTPTVHSGRGGRHCYFLASGLNNGVGVADGIDIRGNGGYIVAVPSLHPTGKQYAWADGLNPTEVPLADPPDWLNALLRAPSRRNEEIRPGTARVPEGKRNNHLTSLAGTMRRKGMAKEAIFAALRIDNSKRCDPPLAETEVAKIAASVAQYAAGPSIAAEPGLVKRLADAIMLTEHFAQDEGGKLYRFMGAFTTRMAALT